MKKALVLIRALARMLPLFCAAEETAAEPFAWRGYSLTPTLFTADESVVRNVNGPTGGVMVLVRFVPQEGLVAMTDIKEYATDFSLITADGKKYSCYSWMVNDFKAEKAEGSIFPEMADEQDDFNLCFFLTKRDETAMDGAQLSVEDGGQTVTVSLEGVPRHLPEETAE